MLDVEARRGHTCLRKHRICPLQAPAIEIFFPLGYHLALLVRDLTADSLGVGLSSGCGSSSTTRSSHSPVQAPAENPALGERDYVCDLFSFLDFSSVRSFWQRSSPLRPPAGPRTPESREQSATRPGESSPALKSQCPIWTPESPRQAVTDDSGRYSVPQLFSGNYRVSVSLAGFDTRQLELLLDPSQTTEQNFRLGGPQCLLRAHGTPGLSVEGGPAGHTL